MGLFAVHTERQQRKHVFMMCGMHYYIYERNVAFKQKWLINYSTSEPNLNSGFFLHTYLLCAIGFKHAEYANIHHKLLINIRMGEKMEPTFAIDIQFLALK